MAWTTPIRMPFRRTRRHFGPMRNQLVESRAFMAEPKHFWPTRILIGRGHNHLGRANKALGPILLTGRGMVPFRSNQMTFLAERLRRGPAGAFWIGRTDQDPWSGRLTKPRGVPACTRFTLCCATWP